MSFASRVKALVRKRAQTRRPACRGVLDRVAHLEQHPEDLDPRVERLAALLEGRQP